jgi:hypothetical protein
MQPWQLGAILSVGVAVLAGGSATRPAPSAASAPTPVAWRSDYEAARVVARQTGKPLFVAFR